MSLIAKATKHCLVRLIRGEDGEWSATFVFPPDYAGFKGHFPGNPVLPGVCMVEAALALLAAAGYGLVRLTRVASAKWVAPVGPGEELCFTARVSGDSSATRTAKVRVTRNGQKIAELSLTVIFAPFPPGDTP